MIDLDDDGRSDLDQLKQVILLNNGKVDAIPGADGEIDGQMTVDTRYLILGEYPDDPREDYDPIRKAWDTMSGEADTLGIEPITLDEFLRLMGWQDNRRSVRLGTGARSADFPAQREKDYKPPSSSPKSDLFRPRKPRPPY